MKVGCAREFFGEPGRVKGRRRASRQVSESALDRGYSGSPIAIPRKHINGVVFSLRKSHLAQGLQGHVNWRTALKPRPTADGAPISFLDVL
jgi:hypothetical protein